MGYSGDLGRGGERSERRRPSERVREQVHVQRNSKLKTTFVCVLSLSERTHTHNMVAAVNNNLGFYCA